MPRRFHLPIALALAGLFATAIHDYAYRRVDGGAGDYELGGLLSHAGSDMVIVTGLLVLVALFWPGER